MCSGLFHSFATSFYCIFFSATKVNGLCLNACKLVRVRTKFLLNNCCPFVFIVFDWLQIFIPLCYVIQMNQIFGNNKQMTALKFFKIHRKINILMIPTFITSSYLRNHWLNLTSSTGKLQNIPRIFLRVLPKHVFRNL